MGPATPRPGTDPAFEETLERLLPPEISGGLAGECRAWAAEVAARTDDLARKAEAEPAPETGAWPVARAAGAAGALLGVTARWGLAGIPSEERLGPWARIHQVALLMLAPPGTPRRVLAHTDAVARVLLACDPALAARSVPGLVSRDPAEATRGALWLEDPVPGEEPGDTRATARPQADGCFGLRATRTRVPAHGDVALILARPPGASPGVRGLSLFLVVDGCGVRVAGVSDRPGDGAWSTLRLDLEEVRAERVGDLGDGPEKLAIGRRVVELHYAAWACGLAARLVTSLRDAAARTGRAPTALRRASVAGLQVEREAGLALAFECARLLGLEETGEATEVERRLKALLVPLARLLAMRQVAAIAAEVSEALGTEASDEASGVPRLLRDARRLGAACEPGDAVCLAFLHEARREDRLESVLEALRGRIHRVGQGPLADLAEPLARRLEGYAGGYRRTLAASGVVAEASARGLAHGFAALGAAVALAEQAAWSLSDGRSGRSAAAARRWIAGRIPRVPDPAASEARLEADALLGGAADRGAGLAPGPSTERGTSG